MAKIGIYGGSFNPVHYGHVGLAQWVIEHTDLDELWLMVSPLNPLKANSQELRAESQEERLAAVREAIKDIPGLVASDFEFALPRPSYTANTLRALQKAYPEHEFTLVIGEDNLAIFDRWRENEYIMQNFRIFVYPRHGSEKSQISNLKSQMSKNIVFLDAAPYFDISSTELRSKILFFLAYINFFAYLCANFANKFLQL